MVFLSLQSQLGDLWFARASYLQVRRSKSKSIVIFIAITLFHLVLIDVVFNSKLKQRETSVVPVFKMIYLSQEKLPDQTELHIPVVERVSINVSVVVPEIIIDEQSTLVLTLDKPSSNHQLPNSNDAQYRDVFDPKMRQKLIDAQVINRPRTKEKTTTWTEIDGRMFVDMGNGECLVSMRKIDSRERETNWGMTRCGKTNSEKMMDNVTADLEARKHPLQTQ